MAFYGLLWQNIVLSRGHRCKFIWSFFFQDQPNPIKPSKREIYINFLDVFVQIFQLAFFISTFSIITHYIVNAEFHESKVQNFILPAIISVFIWMMSTAYILLSLVLDESRKSSRLVFKDQDLEAARNNLRHSLRRRLHDMDRR